MEFDRNHTQKSLLKEENTYKNYKPLFSNLMPDGLDNSNIYETQPADYTILDEEVTERRGLMSSGNKNSPNRNYMNYESLDGDETDSRKVSHQSPPKSENKSNQNNPSSPQMNIIMCQHCGKPVMVEKNTELFRCFYCKKVGNTKQQKSPPTMQPSLKYFICGMCRKTISYAPVSNYIMCVCGSVNYVPSDSTDGKENMNKSSQANLQTSQQSSQTQNPQNLQSQQMSYPQSIPFNPNLPPQFMNPYQYYQQTYHSNMQAYSQMLNSQMKNASGYSGLGNMTQSIMVPGSQIKQNTNK